MRAFLFAIVAMGCAAPAVVVAPNEETGVDPHDPMVLETWDTAGYARNEPSWPTRLGGVSAHLAKGESDVVCVQGLVMQADRDAVLAATKSVYPFSAYRDTDRTTAPDDLHDITGAIPPAQTTPPCGAADEAAWTAAEACVHERQAGRTTVELMAVRSSCDLGGLAPRCGSCLVGSVMSRPLDDLRGDCFTRPDGALAFGGRTDALILSKRPLSDVRYHVSPGLVVRGSMIEATVPFGAGKAVIACSSPMQDPMPYAGDYGAPFQPGTDNAAFAQIFTQVRRFGDIAIARLSGSDGPVFFLGEMMGGPHLDGLGRSKGSDAIDLYLGSNFVRLTSFEDGFGCLSCAKNPSSKLVPHIAPGDVIGSHVLGSLGIPVSRGTVERTGTDVVTFDGTELRPSPFYGVRVVVTPQ